MKLSKKHIIDAIFIIFVPVAITGAYYGGRYGLRLLKQKKVLDAVKEALDKKHKDDKNIPKNFEAPILDSWKVELKKLDIDSFNAFANWFLITVPNGRVKNQTGIEVWSYANSNPTEFDKIKSEFEKHKDTISETKLPDYINAV